VLKDAAKQARVHYSTMQSYRKKLATKLLKYMGADIYHGIFPVLMPGKMGGREDGKMAGGGVSKSVSKKSVFRPKFALAANMNRG
jgi:hypothetical protein